MKLTRERARKPLIADGNCHPATGYDVETKQLTYVLACYGEWTQGKGYDAEYKIELSKLEMLRIFQDWMKVLLDQERHKPSFASHGEKTQGE